MTSQPPSPLAHLNGKVPEAPSWFTENLAAPSEEGFVVVDGVDIEYRAWGERGLPGLVFVHGNAAHLGWWSFLAPMFARDYRVATFSLSGMGKSGRRAMYSMDSFAQESLSVARVIGADDAGPPVLIGHSLGGQPVMLAAARHAEQIGGAIVVDTGLPGPGMMAIPPRPAQKYYVDLPTALARFRYSPSQPSCNHYITDYLARMALVQIEDGTWTWRFDRNLWGDIAYGDPWADLTAVKTRFAVLRGELSTLTAGAMDRRIRKVAPPGTIFVEVPEAHHHVMVDQPLALVASLRTILATWRH